MPEIPLFVSSSQAGAVQTGSFDVRFQPPLRIPEEGKNATVHIAHATIPFTEPNVSAALGNNTLIVALPNATGDGSIPQHTSSAQQQYTVVIPDGLYDVEGLQRAINMAVNGVSDPRARGHYYMRPAGSDFSEIGVDGSTGSAIAKDDVPNWCTLIPDYETNRLHIRLNYIGSAIFFGDARCTLGKVLGFTQDVNTVNETLKLLEDNSVSLDVLWAAQQGDALAQFAITIPALATGYTTASLIVKINQLVEDHLYQVEGIGPAQSPFNAMISSLTVTANPNAPGRFFSKIAYTNASLLRLRGQANSSLDTSSLPRGQLRAGLKPTSSIDNPEFGGVTPIGNPLASEAAYWTALMWGVNAFADGTGAYSAPSDAEQRTGSLIMSLGAHYPGTQVDNVSPETFSLQHHLTGTGHRTWELVDSRIAAEGSTSANFNTVTALGIAVEPIVQGPRDTSGGTSGTLARFAIPKGTQVGDAIAFEHPNPTKVSIQRFVGQDIPRLTFRLVDQDNNAVTDTQGEPFSCVAVLSYDLPQ